MTDKVQKIREEVERMHNLLPVMDGDNISVNYADRICTTLEMYIDSLQEEPVPKIFKDMLNAKTPVESLGISAEEHDKIIDLCLYGKEPEMVDIDDLPKEEPISNDLKEASRNYADKEKFRKDVEKLKSNLVHGACSSQIAMETRCKEEAYNEVLAILDTMQEEPVSEKKCIFTKDNYIDEDRKVLCDGCEEECEYNKKEEPVSEDLEKENKIKILADIIFNAAKYGYMPYDTQDECCAMEIAKENIDKFIVPKKQEEPISEDLEEASKNYALNNTPWDDCKDEIQESFKAGAKWQKTKDESTTEDLGEYINKLSKQFPEMSFAKLSRIAVRVAKWKNEQMMAKAVNVEVKADAGGYPYIPQMELYDYDKDVALAKEGDKYKVVLIKED